MAKIIGERELQRKLRRLGNFKTELAPTIKDMGVHVKGKIAKYPPSSEANAPAGVGKSWYERGYGTRWLRRDGSIGGRKTSETLGRKWTSRTRNGGLTAVVGNNVSYGPFVQGSEQADFHKRRGWKTTDDVAAEENEFVLRKIQKKVDQILASK